MILLGWRTLLRSWLRPILMSLWQHQVLLHRPGSTSNTRKCDVVIIVGCGTRTVRRERAQPRAAAPVRPPPAGPAPGRAAGGRAAPAAYPRTRGAGAPTVQAREGALEALVEQHLGVKL